MEKMKRAVLGRKLISLAEETKKNGISEAMTILGLSSAGEDMRVVDVKEILENRDFVSSLSNCESKVLVFDEFEMLTYEEKIEFSQIIKGLWEISLRKNGEKIIIVISDSNLTQYNFDLALRTVHISN